MVIVLVDFGFSSTEAVEPVDFGGGVVDGCCRVDVLVGLGDELGE